MKMKRREPKLGETVHCWVDSELYVAHSHMVFLGPDKQAKDKLLVPSRKCGFDIIRLSDLSKGNYRALGMFNILDMKVIKKTNMMKSITYQFYDNRVPVEITARLFRGVWRIETKFEMPSWI